MVSEAAWIPVMFHSSSQNPAQVPCPVPPAVWCRLAGPTALVLWASCGWVSRAALAPTVWVSTRSPSWREEGPPVPRDWLPIVGLPVFGVSLCPFDH